nr:putative ribonuclease H-like domain-containing protein [Tanacetum cinerariifolium]
MLGQDKDANGNSTYRMFTPVSAAGSSYDTGIFSSAYDDEVEGVVADFNNLELTTVVEAIRLFLSYASFMGFIVCQIDVKSAFMYGTIEEEVYVCQPPGFEDPHFHDKERLWDELCRLETSMEDVEGVCGAAAHMEQKGGMWPFLGPRNVLRHMTGNKPHLTNYQEIGGGLVAFGENAKGGKLLEKAYTYYCQLNVSAAKSKFTIVGDGYCCWEGFANIKKEGKDFSGKVTPLFQPMMVQAPKDMGEGSEIPTDTHHTPIVTQPSSSLPQKKQKPKRKQRKEIEVPLPISEIPNEESVLDLEEAKTAQAKEISSLKKRVKKLEQKKKSRTLRLKRLRKGRMNEEDMFGVNELDGDKVVVDVEHIVKVVKMEVSTTDPVTIGSKVVTTTSIEVTTAARTPQQISKDELTLAQTLIEIKATKPKAITTAATTVTAAGTRPKEKGIVITKVEEIQMLFNNTMKWIEAFVPMDTELVKDSEKATEGSERAKEEDLEVLWSIVKERFKKTKPVDDMDNLLFQTLKTVFEHHAEDNI